MDQGRAAEIGTPLSLMSDARSLFHHMCVRTGDFDTLRTIATEKERQQDGGGGGGGGGGDEVDEEFSSVRDFVPCRAR